MSEEQNVQEESFEEQNITPDDVNANISQEETIATIEPTEQLTTYNLSPAFFN